MRRRTWSEEVYKRYKSDSPIGKPIVINGKTCIIHRINKDSIDVIEFNKNPQRYKRWK